MRRFQLDPATVKVDWALDRPVPWTSPPDRLPGTVHLADSTDQLVSSLQQIDVHTVPAEPFLLIGQMTTTDPTRSPAGTESFWAYTHVPQEIHGDAGDEGITGAWDHDDAERMADRMQRQIEKYAPGLRVDHHRAAGPDPTRAGAPQREPGRRGHQRRHRRAPPAAGLPSGAWARPGRDADPRSVPRLLLGPPGRRGAWSGRQQRGPRGHRRAPTRKATKMTSTVSTPMTGTPGRRLGRPGRRLALRAVGRRAPRGSVRSMTTGPSRARGSTTRSAAGRSSSTTRPTSSRCDAQRELRAAGPRLAERRGGRSRSPSRRRPDGAAVTMTEDATHGPARLIPERRPESRSRPVATPRASSGSPTWSRTVRALVGRPPPAAATPQPEKSESGDLSGRSPRQDGWRSRPSDVKPL